MFVRPILSRICRCKPIANFCSLQNRITPPVTANPENAVSASYSEKRAREKAEMVSYLMNSCGLSRENAVSVSTNIHFTNLQKPNIVLNFLEKQGFTKSQISSIVKGCPILLLCDPEKKILPKLKFFLNSDLGSEADILAAVSRSPGLLHRKLERTELLFSYLKDIMGIGKIRVQLKRGSWLLCANLGKRIIPKVEYLKKLGVPQSSIRLSFSHWPGLFTSYNDEFREVVKEVVEMGFDPSKSMFPLAIFVRSGKAHRAAWDRCYQTYSEWGWSRDDIMMAFRKHPHCMTKSVKKISSTLDFLVNKVGLESRLVAKFPQALFYDLEKRIIPRCSVVHFLFLKGFMKTDWSLTSVLCPAEERFQKKYVERFSNELPQLSDIYSGQETIEW